MKLEAAIAMISGKSPVSELSQKYGVHPGVLQRWKTELLEGGADIFSRRKKRAEDGPTVYTMEASHAVEVLEAAIQRHGKPEIANSDQGSQFTGESWILALEAHTIKISHDGIGRCIDNIRVERLWWSIKYEHVHLYCYQTMWELEKGLEVYLIFYNTRRRYKKTVSNRDISEYQVNEPAPTDAYFNNIIVHLLSLAASKPDTFAAMRRELAPAKEGGGRPMESLAEIRTFDDQRVRNVRFDFFAWHNVMLDARLQCIYIG